MLDDADIDDLGFDPPAPGRVHCNHVQTCSSTGDSPLFGRVHSLDNVGAQGRALRKPNLAAVVNLIAGIVSARALSLPGAFGMLLSMAATAQGLIASDQPAPEAGPAIGPTMMQVAPYRYETYALPDVAPAVPSCYRIGRCSAQDLYRFRDRPNRLTRLAPEAPPPPTSIQYLWFIVPVTPEENIVPRYRSASQIRDEYRAVGSPIDSLN